MIIIEVAWCALIISILCKFEISASIAQNNQVNTIAKSFFFFFCNDITQYLRINNTPYTIRQLVFIVYYLWLVHHQR